MRKRIFLYFISVFTCIGCATSPKLSQFEKNKSQIEKVAVLPFEIIFTGKIPKKTNEEMLEVIKSEESIAYQSSFSKILALQNSGKNLSIQATQKTLDILESKDISIKESWRMHPQLLAEILEVDAVVKSRIKRKVELPNQKAQRRNTLIRVLNMSGVFSGSPVPLPQSNDPNAQNIKVDYVLVESRKGDILWKKSILWNGNKNIALAQKADLVNQNSYFIFP